MEEREENTGFPYRFFFSFLKKIIFYFYLLFTYPWEAVVAPKVSCFDGPLGALLGQNGLLSFPFGKRHRTTLGTAHGQAAYSCEEDPH